MLSHHVQLLLRAPQGNLADFMAYGQGNVAKGVNALHGRRGPLWQRRYSAEPVLDPEALLDRAGHVLANPVLGHSSLAPKVGNLGGTSGGPADRSRR